MYSVIYQIYSIKNVGGVHFILKRKVYEGSLVTLNIKIYQVSLVAHW